MTVDVFVSIGSNIEPEVNVRAALESLNSYFGEIKISPVYETPAYGFRGPRFHNLVVGFQSACSATKIHQKLRSIEAEQNRQRSGESFDSRTLDLDLLTYGDQVIEHADFAVPHADIMRYSFVLKPMLDLAPDFLHPVANKSLHQLWSEMDPVDRGELVDISGLYSGTTVNC